MNENENFESLRRLLALKRHEVPPPGYFNRFSGNVIARIRAGEQPSDAAENLARHAPWLLKFFQMFEAKPAFASSFASALCLLLLFGIVYAERPDATPQPILQTSQADSGAMGITAVSSAVAPAPELIANSFSNSSPSSLQPLFNGAFAQQVSFSH
ncbi:MAG TPA: hypothetical protein VN625_03035 [Desulfuromonadaceae bacterium]|nr:hypothetical protein [Desulfuromonadaceae bacterium]